MAYIVMVDRSYIVMAYIPMAHLVMVDWHSDLSSGTLRATFM